MSLRARLLLGVLVLAAIGLIVADVITYTSLNSFLVGRVDEQLLEAVQPTSRFLSEAPVESRQPRRGPSPFPPGTYAALLNSDGSVVSQITFGFTSSEQDPRPQLPADLPKAGDAPRLLTLPGSGSVEGYRTVIQPVQQTSTVRGSMVIVAIPTEDIESTLNRLLLLEVIVGLAVLAVIAGLGMWVVRLGLLPLDHMAETAGAIAGGDLQRRVSPATTRTEVGRLGLALNAMLARIEEAFAARRESEERLRRFVADASHELRTPVSSIRGYAELFRRGAASRPEDLAMTMRRIEDEAARMGHLVDDLLLLARLDEGRPLERGPVNLSLLAIDASADARALDQHRAVRVDAEPPVVVIGDELRLRQVVSNLVRNAIFHTPAGTAIDITVKAVDANGLVEVADHGKGIVAEVREKIFERFYRSDVARGRSGGSTGLGLSIVAAVVAAHHGRVTVTDTSGGGATFTVSLPLFTAASGGKPAESSPRVSAPVEPATSPSV